MEKGWRVFKMVMTKRRLIWLIPAVIWVMFTLWYTDLGGPLTDEEIDEGLAQMAAQGWDTGNLSRIEPFLRSDTGRHFVMVNSIDLNETPPRLPSFEAGASAQQYVDFYMEHMYVQLLSRASHPVFAGLAVGPSLDVEGVEGVEEWNMAGLIRYRSRRSFLEIIMHPDMRERHDYKIAAMTKTFAYPVEPSINPGDLRVLAALLLALMAAVFDIVLIDRRRH